MAGEDFPNNQNLGIAQKVEVSDQAPDWKFRIVVESGEVVFLTRAYVSMVEFYTKLKSSRLQALIACKSGK
jgi:hypothetical protein